MSKDDDDEAVGYCRPPMKTRFKPGQSGNPRGRRKGSTSFATDLRRMLQSPVVVHDHGKSRTVTTLQAILMRAGFKALKGGSSRDITTVLDYAQSHCVEMDKEDGRATNSVDQAMLDHYRERILQERDADASPDAKSGESSDEPE